MHSHTQEKYIETCTVLSHNKCNCFRVTFCRINCNSLLDRRCCCCMLCDWDVLFDCALHSHSNLNIFKRMACCGGSGQSHVTHSTWSETQKLHLIRSTKEKKDFFSSVVYRKLNGSLVSNLLQKQIREIITTDNERPAAIDALKRIILFV